MDKVKVGLREYNLDSVYIGRANSLWCIDIEINQLGGKRYYLKSIDDDRRMNLSNIKYLREVKNIEEVLDCEVGL